VAVRQVQLLVLTLITAAFAQTLPEPDTNDVFYALQDKLVALERQQAVWENKGSGFAGLSTKIISEIAGGRSPVRFKATARLEFIVRSRLATPGADPNTIYSLRKLDAKKKKREMTLTTGHAPSAGTSAKTELSQGVLSVDFTKYGESSYKLAVGPLKPGEYALGAATLPQRVFCFGVD
jgi:hypothetical protein